MNQKFRVYIAAASTPEEMIRVERCALRLVEAGVQVTSTWPAVIGQVGATNPRNASASDRRGWSRQDLAEVASSDALWLLCPPPGTATRGAWCEFGVAWSRSLLVVSSGDTKQSIFTALGHERLQSGEVLYDPDGRSTGYDTTAAYLWLWQPELAEASALEVSKRLKCGRVTATRAR